jgi:glycosyltransferase involved in cell wall biosynthesis
MPGTVSVLIVTHRREKLVERCLRSVLEAAQATPETGPRIELIVHVNGSDPASATTLELFSRVARSLGIAFSYREEPSALSPAGARNRALAEASGDWVFFADDDVFLPPTLFRDFARLLERFPGAIALGGPNLTPPDSNAFQRASGLALSSPFATWQSTPRYRAEGKPRECGEESLILCNLFVRKDMLGPEPFLDSLKCGEENWLIRRLSLSGRPVVYAPELLVWHERRKSVTGFARQVFWYGYGRGQNLRLALGEPPRPEARGLLREGPRRALRYFLPSLCVLYSVALMAFALTGHAPAAFGLPYLAYAVLCAAAAGLAAGSGNERAPERALSALLFPVIHSFYGVGVLCGIARRE